MRKETRAGKSGRFSGALLDNAMENILRGLTASDRDAYLSLFGRELENFSFEKIPVARRGERKDYELESYADSDVSDPILVARTIKERWHLEYQADTIYKDVRAFLSFFMDGLFRPILDKMRHLPDRHRDWEDDEYVYPGR